MKKVTIVYPEELGVIAPEIYGHFSEHIGGVFYGGLWVGKESSIPNERGFRKDALDYLRRIKPPVLRWPGGCFAEAYNWRDGIGEDRPTRPQWWTSYDGRYESNAVGTHEFFDLCELIGAKAYLAVNVTSITPLEAREWLDYCLSPRGATTLALEREKNGHPEPFDIDYIGVGNENWGGGGNMTADYYALEYRRFVTVMKNICNTAAKKPVLVAGGANAADYSWTIGLSANLTSGRHIPHTEAMSFHYYCGTAGEATEFSKEQWYELIEKAENMEKLVTRHYAITKAYGAENTLGRLVVDEWGCWHKDGSGPSKGYNLFEQQSTMRDAVVSAITLNIFNNHCDKVYMANAAQICNNLHCCLLCDGKDNCIITPTYHVFDMFKRHQGATAIRSLVSDNGDLKNKLSVSASKTEGGMTVTVANLSCENEVSFELDLLGVIAASAADATLLTADDMRAHNTFDAPNAVRTSTATVDITKPVVIAPFSVMTLFIPVK